MFSDVAQQIGAVTRVVGSRDKDGRPARIVLASRSYDTTVEDVWDALTNPERIPRWFLPISGELRLGGHYQLEGNAGGEITQCEPPRHFALTWAAGGGEDSWVDVQLIAEPGGGTRLELEHVAHVPEEMWNEYGPGGVGVGWDSALLALNQHLATGATLDAQAGQMWMGSAEGKVFVTASSNDWCRASIAAGTDAATARAAADRTTAAYTGAGSEASAAEDAGG
jgi:uncharacterized protein YndB with AHSA1/START domain